MECGPKFFKMGTEWGPHFEWIGDQKTNFGPHGDQSPQMGTNVGAVDFDSDETSQDLESQSTTESTS